MGDHSKISKSGRISLYLKDQACGRSKYETMRIDELEATDQSMKKFYSEVLRPVYCNGVLINELTFDEVRQGTRLDF